MNTTETIEKLREIARCMADDNCDWPESLQESIQDAITLLQKKEKDTELLNEADAMWSPGDGHCVEITWGKGTHYQTCREALSELVTAIAAQQEAESVETDQQKGEG